MKKWILAMVLVVLLAIPPMALSESYLVFTTEPAVYGLMLMDDNGEVIIMRMEKDGDEDILVSIEDEDELDRAFEAFKQSASEEYDFEDDDEDSEDDDFE